MLSRFSGMLRDMVMASAFGTQETVAAFFVAFRFAHLLRRLFGEGAMQAAFIPQFEALRQSNTTQAGSFFRDLVAIVTVILSVLIVLIMLGLGGCLTFLDLSPGNEEILFLTLVMMPSLLFICLFGLNASLLQCERHYFITGAAPVAFNLIWIMGVVYLWHTPPAWAMTWLAGCVIVACMCQWLITLPSVWKVLKGQGLARSWRKICLFSQDVQKLKKPLMLGILGVAASQINNALDALFARFAEAEGPAYLWYALRVQQLPLALFGIAISGALLPPLSRALKGNNMTLFRLFLEFALRRTMALLLPITAMFFVMGDRCINFIYGRGDFTDLSTVGTSQCLWGYSAGLIPMAFILVLAPAFYAQNDYRTPATASLVSMLLNAVLNAWLIFGLHYGSVSVAYATSISAWVNSFWLMSLVRQHLSQHALREVLGSMGKVLLASCIASAAAIAVDVFVLQGNPLWKIWRGDIPVYPRGFAAQLTDVLIQLSTFSATFVAVAWLLNATDVLDFLGREKGVSNSPYAKRGL